MEEQETDPAATDLPVLHNLFKNLDIFITHRVPQRSHYIKLVKDHGGNHMYTDRKANVVIADHLRRDAPAGSLSYKWLEQCIQQQRLVDKDALGMRAAATEAQPRTVGSLKPAKSSRTPYTDADDSLLQTWVDDHVSRGFKPKGNEIYKALEKQHPQHPWQSWRDRWIMYVSKRAPASSAPQHRELAGGGIPDVSEPLISSTAPPASTHPPASPPAQSQPIQGEGAKSLPLPVPTTPEALHKPTEPAEITTAVGDESAQPHTVPTITEGRAIPSSENRRKSPSVASRIRSEARGDRHSERQNDSHEPVHESPKAKLKIKSSAEPESHLLPPNDPGLRMVLPAYTPIPPSPTTGQTISPTTRTRRSRQAGGSNEFKSPKMASLQATAQPSPQEPFHPIHVREPRDSRQLILADESHQSRSPRSPLQSQFAQQKAVATPDWQGDAQTPVQTIERTPRKPLQPQMTKSEIKRRFKSSFGRLEKDFLMIEALNIETMYRIGSSSSIDEAFQELAAAYRQQTNKSIAASEWKLYWEQYLRKRLRTALRFSEALGESPGRDHLFAPTTAQLRTAQYVKELNQEAFLGTHPDPDSPSQHLSQRQMLLYTESGPVKASQHLKVNAVIEASSLDSDTSDDDDFHTAPLDEDDRVSSGPRDDMDVNAEPRGPRAAHKRKRLPEDDEDEILVEAINDAPPGKRHCNTSTAADEGDEQDPLGTVEVDPNLPPPELRGQSFDLYEDDNVVLERGPENLDPQTMAEMLARAEDEELDDAHDDRAPTLTAQVAMEVGEDGIQEHGTHKAMLEVPRRRSPRAENRRHSNSFDPPAFNQHPQTGAHRLSPHASRAAANLKNYDRNMAAHALTRARAQQDAGDSSDDAFEPLPTRQSCPRRYREGTQALLDEDTQPPDIDVVLPEDEADAEDAEAEDEAEAGAEATLRQSAARGESQSMFVSEDEEADMSAGEPSHSKARMGQSLLGYGRRPVDGQSQSPAALWARKAEQLVGKKVNGRISNVCRSVNGSAAVKTATYGSDLQRSKAKSMAGPERPLGVGDTATPGKLKAINRDLKRSLATSSAAKPPVTPSSQPPMKQTGQSAERALADWVEEHEEMGIERRKVFDVLSRCSNNADVAHQVLERFVARGRLVPADFAGYWTPQQDEVCRSGNAKAMRRLERLHGVREYEERMNFLNIPL